MPAHRAWGRPAAVELAFLDNLRQLRPVELELAQTARQWRLCTDLLRAAAPSLRQGDNPLGGGLEVRMFLSFDTRWRDLLG